MLQAVARAASIEQLATSQPDRAMLAATRDPVQALLGDDSELGALLHDVCATGYPCRVVVADQSELKIIEERRPCAHIEWRHREHLFDLPSLVQCRCRKESICENGALLWHLHRIYRLDVLRRAGNVSSMCGFVP